MPKKLLNKKLKVGPVLDDTWFDWARLTQEELRQEELRAQRVDGLFDWSALEQAEECSKARAALNKAAHQRRQQRLAGMTPRGRRGVAICSLPVLASGHCMWSQEGGAGRLRSLSHDKSRPISPRCCDKRPTTRAQVFWAAASRRQMK
ncbi:unnamed protein product [Symbiodinium sp. CCMP2592]|nr:unnamed protein product [Symbiodinium sp. CCMP2592]